MVSPNDISINAQDIQAAITAVHGGDKVSIQKYIDDFERAYLRDSAYDYLAQYLFLMYDSIGASGMAQYYALVAHDDLIQDYPDMLDRYFDRERLSAKCGYAEYDFCRHYALDNEEREYQVLSFAKEIGQNLTVLKTVYGSIIFDCGAKFCDQSPQYISKERLQRFLVDNDISIDSILACLISHAHFDHYGSMDVLGNIGVPSAKIFMGNNTKDLISVSGACADLDSIGDIGSFWHENIVIERFDNGHICGSEGYIVSFDGINVVFTGDFCLYDQNTVHGLVPNDILRTINKSRRISVKEIDCLITESTYGKWRNAFLDFDSACEVLRHFAERAKGQEYKMLLPAFAMGRSQELALITKQVSNSILIDGQSREISQKYDECDFRELRGGVRILDGGVALADDNDTALDNIKFNDIIISSSGMIHKESKAYNYIQEVMRDEQKVLVVKTGYIAPGTDGDQILSELANSGVRVLSVPLSSHANHNQIVRLINALKPKNVVAIHGKGLDCFE